MAASVPRHTEIATPAFLGDRMDHDIISTAFECASNVTESVLTDPNLYVPAEPRSLFMTPAADAHKGHTGYGSFVGYSPESCITTGSASLTESYLNCSMIPLELLQPNAGFSYSTTGEVFPIENSNATIQQVANGQTDDTASERKGQKLAERRLQNRVNAAKFRERKKAEKEALQQQIESLSKQQRELERQVHDLQGDIKVMTVHKDLVMQENASLRLKMYKANGSLDV